MEKYNNCNENFTREAQEQIWAHRRIRKLDIDQLKLSNLRNRKKNEETSAEICEPPSGIPTCTYDVPGKEREESKKKKCFKK